MLNQPSLASPKVSAASSGAGPLCFFSFSFLFTPETTSSILKSRQEASIAVLRTWFFTATGSQTFASYMLPIFFLFPSMPNAAFPFSACLALNSVMILTTSIPQFVAKVFGMISKA